MIRTFLRRLFQPYRPTPPIPDVQLTSREERRDINEKMIEIQARMERLQLEAERPALRRIYER